MAQEEQRIERICEHCKEEAWAVVFAHDDVVCNQCNQQMENLKEEEIEHLFEVE